MLKELVIELIVKDIKKTVDFYEKYFNFSIEMAAPDNENFTWVQITNQNIKIMMQDFNQTKDEIINFPNTLASSNLIVLKYNNVEKIKEIYKLLLNDKIKFFTDIKETEYGTVEFGVFDPNNNMVLVSGEK